jgi:hypothetical protein
MALNRMEKRERELDEYGIEFAEWLRQVVFKQVEALETPGNVELIVEYFDATASDPPPGHAR